MDALEHNLMVGNRTLIEYLIRHGPVTEKQVVELTAAKNAAVHECRGLLTEAQVRDRLEMTLHKEAPNEGT